MSPYQGRKRPRRVPPRQRARTSDRSRTREFSVDGFMQHSFLQRLERGAAFPGPAGPGGGGWMDGSDHSRAAARSLTGIPDGPNRPSRLFLPVWALLAVAAAVGVALTGASLTVAGCAAGLAVATLAIGWRVGEKGMGALEDEIESRTSELKRALSELEIAQAETVQRLSMAVEFRDEDTGAHIERIGRFSVLLAEQIGMEQEFSERLRHAAPLHDVGKVAIPDAILLKPGPLTPEERAIVETHAEESHRLRPRVRSPILRQASPAAFSPHCETDWTGW